MNVNKKYIKALFFCFILIFIYVSCNLRIKFVEERNAYNSVLDYKNRNELEEFLKKIDDFKVKYPNSKKILELDIQKEKTIKTIENNLFKKILDSKEKEYYKIKSEIEKYKKHYSNSANLNKILEIEQELKEKERIKDEERKQKIREQIAKEKEEAEKKKLEKEKKAKERKEKAKKISHSSYDEFKDIRWFYGKDNDGNKTTHNEKIVLYGGGYKEEYKPSWLRVVFKFNGSDWIFFDKVIILVDGETNYISFNYFDGKRDTYYGGVVEYYDIPATEHKFLLKKIADSKVAKIRFEGKNYYRDFTITSSEKQKIKNLLTVYEEY